MAEWMPTDEERAEAMRYMSPYAIPYQEHTVMIRLAQRKLVEDIEAHIAYRFLSGTPPGVKYVAIPESYLEQLKQEVGLDG